MDNHNSLAKKESLPFPTEFCKIFAIQEILNGSPELSTIFFSFLSSEESLNIIQSLFISDPPNSFRTSKNIPTAQHYRWMLSCFMSFFISQIPNRKKFVLPSYYFNIPKAIQLSGYTSATTNSIIKLLTNPVIRMSNDHQIKLSKLLLKLYDEIRPLFEWIIEYREVSKCIKSIPLSTLFSQHNYKCFQLYRVDINETNDNKDAKSILFDESELNGIRFYFKEKEEIESFFSIPSVLLNGRPITTFQNSFFQEHQYPYQYPFDDFNNETKKEIFSLIHTSISLKKFFVDVVKEDISKTLTKNNEELLHLQDPSNIKNAKNDEYNETIKNNKIRLNETVNNSSILNEMQSWTFLSLFPDILSNYEQLYEQIESLSFVSDNIASKLFERLKNDHVLFSKIHEWTGKFVTINDFATKSMPSEILVFMKNLDSKTVYQSIENKPLLCLSDSDKLNDCDFLYGYLAISNEIKAISTPQSFEQIEPIAEEIEFCIERISSIEKKNSIIIDLFSLLFLTNEGQFLYHTLSMQTISQILLSNASEKVIPYLSNGLVQIQLFERSSKVNNSPLSDLFISSKNKLLYALRDGNTVFAENLAKTSPENEKLFNCYKTVKNYVKQIQSKNRPENNSNIEIDEDGQSSFINIDSKPIDEVEEVALSVEGQNYLFDRISKETKLNEVKQLTTNFDYKKPFKVIKTFSKKKLAFLKEKLDQRNETKWKIPSFIIDSKTENLNSNNQQIVFNDPNKLDKIKLLKGFFDYLDLLIPTLLSPGQTIETVLNKSVDEILDEFLTKEEFEKAEKLSETMKVNIRKKVLSSFKYQPKCYEHYSDGLNPVLTTVSLLGNFKDYFLKLNQEEETQKVLLKLLNGNENLRKFVLKIKEQDFIEPTNDNIYDEIEFNDNFYQEGFNVTEKVLSDALENNNNDLFIDLCFRSTTEKIEAVFNGHLNDDTIEKLFELMKLCPVSFEFRRKYQLLYDLHHKYSYQISNINQSFIDFLSEKKFFEAKKFYDCFPENKEDFDQIVKENLLNEDENVDIGIIMVAPHLRKEILDFFKKLKIEEEEQKFQDLIPLNWIYMNDFEETVDTNIYNDPNGAVQLLTELELLDCDRIIIEYLNQVVIQNDDLSFIEKIDFFRKESKRFVSVIRNKDSFYNFISSNLLNLLLSIRIESEDDEIALNFNFRRMMNFLNSKIFSHKKIDKKIDSIFNCCSQFFYLKYNFAYNFEEIEKIADFAADEGFYHITKEISESFDVEITEKSFEIYLTQFRLYFFNTKAVLPFSLKENKHQEKVRFELQKKCSSKFAYYASKQSEFNGNLVKKIESSFENNQINGLLSNLPSSYFTRNDDDEERKFSLNDQKNEMFDFFSNQADIETASKFYVTDIEKGFLLLENLEKNSKNEKEIEDQRKTGFFDLFVTSLSYSKLNIFMKLFRQFDPRHTKYAHFLRSTYDDIDSSSFPFLKFSISQIMGDFLTTAKTALKVYTIKPDLAYLDIAQSSLAELTNFLTQKVDSKSSKSDSKSSYSNSEIENLSIEKVKLLLENIKRTLHKIDLQRQFIVFCIENRISDFETLNLFLGPAATDSIITLLFKNSEFQLSIEILRLLNQTENRSTADDYSIEPSHSSFSMEETGWFNSNKAIEYETSLAHAAFSLANDGFNAVIKFVLSLQKKLNDEREFERILYAFIKQFESAPFNEIDWILYIAMNVVKSNRLKVKILIEIGEFDLAADIATERRNKLESFIPLIANLSFTRSNMNAFYKCQKALEYSS